jgi:hypothetical protein
VEYNREKVDEVVLALMYLTLFDDDYGCCAWTSFDEDVLARLRAKGLVGTSGEINGSVRVTPEGLRRAEETFFRLFAAPDAT